jgi:glycosyltransferase involved in cell wall biosynthesis
VIRKYSNARIILRAHNIEHLIWERVSKETSNPLKKWYLGKLASALKKYEETLALKVDGIVPITQNDSRYFEALVNKAKSANPDKQVMVCAIPFGVKPPDQEPDELKSLKPALFTLGAMNWIPNQEGVKWFLDKVWPDIHKQFPDLEYYLAGRAMPPWMLNLKLPNVKVLGEIDDAAAFMKKLPVMIVPLFSGSGIRIKIIEGMAASKTIISTSVGAEGIDCTHQKNILIADTPCEFFEMISVCVTDPAVIQKIGIQARNLIQDSYNPETLIRRLTTFYQQLS